MYKSYRVSWQSIYTKRSYWLVPALLLIIGLYQISESSFGTLTHWKGGGFGMFSTMDGPDARFLKAFLITDKGEVPVSVPSDFSRGILLIQTWPRRAELETLASELANRSWLNLQTPRQNLQSELNKKQFAKLLSPQSRPSIVIATTQPDMVPSSIEQLHVNSVRVEVWKSRLDSTGTVLDSYCLISATSVAPTTRKTANP